MKFIKKGKVIGEVVDKTYVTYRDSKEHYFIKKKGYAISTDVLDAIKKFNVEKIKIIESKESEVLEWECPVTHFECAEVFQFPGYDAQKCVPLTLMTRCENVGQN